MERFGAAVLGKPIGHRSTVIHNAATPTRG